MSTVDVNFRFYSVPEAAAELSLSGGRIRQLLLAGELVGYKLGDKETGNWVIPADALEQFKRTRKKNRQAPKPEPVKS